MTEAAFGLAVDLRKGLAQRRIKKERIISKSVLSSGLKGYPSFTFAVKEPLLSSIRDRAAQRDYANEPCPSLLPRQTFQRSKQFLVVSKIVRILPAVARRMDAGGSIEGVHLQTGIVSQCKIAGKFCQGPGFFEGVLLESPPILNHARKVAKVI
mgnify:CR=1 FL=1